MPDPMVSIIVATFNAEATLQACVDSVASQSADVELIVVDGGSTDGTVDIIRGCGDVIAWTTSQPDDGIYDAWNTGLAHACAPWISFLGADDRLASDDSVADLLAGASRCAGRRVIYGTNEITDDAGLVIDRHGAPWNEIRDRFRREMCMPHPGTLHHRSLFDDNGPFNTSFRIAGDYELLLRELVRNDACFVDNTVTAIVASGGVSRAGGGEDSFDEATRALAMHGIYADGATQLRLRAKHRVKRTLVQLLGAARATKLVRRFRPHRRGDS